MGKQRPQAHPVPYRALPQAHDPIPSWQNRSGGCCARAPHPCTPRQSQGTLCSRDPPAPFLQPSTALTAPSQGSRAAGTASGPTQSPQTVAEGSLSRPVLGWARGCSRPSSGSVPATTRAFFGQGSVPCFSAFSVVAKTLPSAQEQAQPRLGLPGGHGCAPGTAVPELCALAQHAPLREAFWGSLSVRETLRWNRQGTQPVPHVQDIPPVQKRETGRVKRDTLGREREQEGWSPAGHVTSRDQGHGDTPSTNPRTAWIGK